MPAPRAVELLPYDPQWAFAARSESKRLTAALGKSLLNVYHIGSTAIPGLRAKPILDLIPVFANRSALDETRVVIESLGYAWRGENGLSGRRYYTFDDPITRRRKVHLHGYLVGSEEISRHLAFRDYLRGRPDITRAYEAEKERCRALYPLDSQGYSECKGEWVRRIQQEALRALSTRSPEEHAN